MMRTHRQLTTGAEDHVRSCEMKSPMCMHMHMHMCLNVWLSWRWECRALNLNTTSLLRF